MSELCISCNFSVGRRQAITCDVCGRKQHRLCGTGNLFTFYVFNFKRHSLRDRYVYLFVNLKVISAVHER